MRRIFGPKWQDGRDMWNHQRASEGVCMISITSSLCLLPRRSGGRLRCKQEDKTNLYAFNQKPPYQTLYACCLWCASRGGRQHGISMNSIPFSSLYIYGGYTLQSIYIHNLSIQILPLWIVSFYLFIFIRWYFLGFTTFITLKWVWQR